MKGEVIQMLKTVRFHRDTCDHRLGWEIVSWNDFFIVASIGILEFRINKYPKRRKKKIKTGTKIHEHLENYNHNER